MHVINKIGNILDVAKSKSAKFEARWLKAHGGEIPWLKFHGQSSEDASPVDKSPWVKVQVQNSLGKTL